MLVPQATKQFRKDNKRVDRQGKDMDKLDAVLSDLIDEKNLDPALCDHPLQGDMSGFRELHIEPDWLLVYKKDGNKLVLVRTGSHSELFDKRRK